MKRTGLHPLTEWRAANHPDKQTDILIGRWLKAAIAVEECLEVQVLLSNWYHDNSVRVPDIVACVSWYGRARLLVQGRRDAPIAIPLEDQDRWRNRGFHPTFEDFEDRLASVAGGFLLLAGHAPEWLANTINVQLDSKLADLRRAADLPLESYYTIRELTDDDIEDGDDLVQQRRLARAFVIREQLECFEFGMEKVRLFALSEREEELGLPNRKLFDALRRIDLNSLLAELEPIDDRLRVILGHLAKQDYYDLDVDMMPERFWWRHWKKVRSRRGS